MMPGCALSFRARLQQVSVGLDMTFDDHVVVLYLVYFGFLAKSNLQGHVGSDVRILGPDVSNKGTPHLQQSSTFFPN